MTISEGEFLEVYPVLHVLMEKGHHSLWEPLEGFLDDAHHQSTGPDKLSPKAIKGFKNQIQPSLETVRTALEDTRLVEWNPDFYPPFIRAVELLDGAEDHEQLDSAEEALDDALDRLSRCIDSKTTAVFGKWAVLFWMAVDAADGYVSLEGKGVERIISELLYSLGSEDGGAPTGSPPLELDEQTFSVCIEGRKPCFLGNNKRFRLLAALAQSPNKYIEFSDLAEQLGGDAWDVDALPASKFRLCHVLSSNGYADLARSIRSQPGHYGLFLK